MSTRKEKDRLKQMSKERSFRIEKRGDSHYGVADGYRSKRIMFRGNTTDAGNYLQSKGVHLPQDRLNKTVRTIFVGILSMHLPNRAMLCGCVILMEV